MYHNTNSIGYKSDSRVAANERAYTEKGKVKSYWMKLHDGKVSFGGGDEVGEDEFVLLGHTDFESLYLMASDADHHKEKP